MKLAQPSTIIVLALACSGCQTIDEQGALSVGQAEILRTDGSSAGRAVLFRSADELTINVALSRIEVNEVDLAFSANGACPATDGSTIFLTDLPSATVGENGSITVSAWLPGAPGQVLSQLFDDDGTAIAVSQSEGNQSLLACGVFRAN